MGNLTTRINTAVILAAGYGKRLRPYTEKIPKSLLCVNGKPVIDSIFHALLEAKICNVIVVIGYLGNMIKNHATIKYSNTLNISFITQNVISGSAAGLEQAKTSILKSSDDNFLVVAGDYQLPRNYLLELIEFHYYGQQDISLSLREINKNKLTESSQVELGANDLVINIHEKPKNIVISGNPLASSLLYILPRSTFGFLPSLKVSERGEKELPILINNMIETGFVARGLRQQPLFDWEKEYRST